MQHSNFSGRIESARIFTFNQLFTLQSDHRNSAARKISGAAHALLGRVEASVCVGRVRSGENLGGGFQI
jgi:hypothetical protein